MTVSEQIEQFEAEARATEEKERDARDAARDAQAGTYDHPAIVKLQEIDRAVTWRKPGWEGLDPREASVALCQAVLEDESLVLVSTGGAKLRLDSVAPGRAFAAARKAHNEATWRLEDFRREHRDELLALERERRAAEFKDAVESGDEERMKEAFGLGRTRALTTARLAQPG